MYLLQCVKVREKKTISLFSGLKLRYLMHEKTHRHISGKEAYIRDVKLSTYVIL